MCTRRRVVTIIAVIGVAVVATKLASVWPRDSRIDYRVGTEVVRLDADYLLENEAVVSVRFRRPDPETSVFGHTVRLQPGKYHVHITLYVQDKPPTETVRTLQVPTAGVTRFDLRRLGPSP